MGKLVLFVHGLGGSAKSTWGKFPTLIAGDQAFAGMNTGFFEYPTLLVRLPFSKRCCSVQTLAQALRTEIDTRFSAYKEVVLVCHSLGGLIAKKYILDEIGNGKQLRVSSLLFYAVPHHGAGLASIASHISWRHSQLKELCKDSELVATISKSWRETQPEKHLNIRYVVAAQDRVVSEKSAQDTWNSNNVDVVTDKGHIAVVKPETSNDLSFLILKKAIGMKNMDPTPPHPLPPRTFPSDPLAFQPAQDCNDLRIAASAIIRMESDGRYLLVRNLHRPESFAPFGGVYKIFPTSREALDAFGFRAQRIDADMSGDLRGFIDPKALTAFKNWFFAGNDREQPVQCLQRELQEKLTEIGFSSSIGLSGLPFRHVRTVLEGPEYISSQKHNQFRIFDIYDLPDTTDESRMLRSALEDFLSKSPGLFLATAEEIINGRASNGDIIGPHAAYLFDVNRYRMGDPLFKTR